MGAIWDDRATIDRLAGPIGDRMGALSDDEPHLLIHEEEIRVMYGQWNRNEQFGISRTILASLTLLAAVWWPATGARADGPQIRADEGRPDVSWRDADKVVGRMAFVSGKVVDLYQPRSGKLNLLRVGEGDEWNFTIVIPTSEQKNFPKPVGLLYPNKFVRVSGMITTYGGKPQVFVGSPDQIQVLETLPETKPFTRKEFPPADEITVATYNILNLFDDVDDPFTGDEFTRTKPRAELEQIADQIRKLNADVIAFEEVESRGYLARFLEAFLPDMGYDHVVLYEGNDLRGIDVCLASRIPVGPVSSYRHVTFPDADGNPMRMRRDLLRVQLDPPNAEPFEVWVVHLKSKGGGADSDTVRVGEARFIRKLLDAELQSNPEARIIVCGDFNDTWDSTSLKTIVGDGSTAMQCFASELSQEQKISYNKEPYRSMIDFVLCSPALARGYVKGSYAIHPGSVETTGSDHNPVTARYKIK